MTNGGMRMVGVVGGGHGWRKWGCSASGAQVCGYVLCMCVESRWQGRLSDGNDWFILRKGVISEACKGDNVVIRVEIDFVWEAKVVNVELAVGAAIESAVVADGSQSRLRCFFGDNVEGDKSSDE